MEFAPDFVLIMINLENGKLSSQNESEQRDHSQRQISISETGIKERVGVEWVSMRRQTNESLPLNDWNCSDYPDYPNIRSKIPQEIDSPSGRQVKRCWSLATGNPALRLFLAPFLEKG